MSNDLDLPPFTSIPSDVRDRVRRKVRDRIRRPRSYRRPLAAAAAVALLAAGAVFLLSKGPGTLEPAGPTRTDTTLDRCWNAIRDTGAGTDNYPDRSTWKVPVLYDALPYSDLIAVGISAGEKKFFCEATETTVNITSPSAQLHYAEGTQTALAMLTPNGTMAGVIDPSWPAAWFSEPGGFQTREQPRDGMFVVNPGRSLENAKILTRRGAGFPVEETNPGYSGAELPKPPTLGVSVHDRPPAPQDRASAAGRTLGDCLAHAGDNSTALVLDPDSYGPGPLITRDQATMVLARSETRVAACLRSPTGPGTPELVSFGQGPRLSDIDSDNVPVAFYPGAVNLSDGARFTLAGTVPAATARVEIRFGNGVTESPAVANRTFGLILPDRVAVDGDNRITDAGRITVRLIGAGGDVFYEGPLPIWHPN
jgi:hypothetical protein